MPSLNISLPGVPTLLTGLSPIAANPIAAIGGAPTPEFATVISGLGAGFTLDASPPLGTNLPPQRPELAGSPETLPELDVEAVMVGATGAVPAPDAATPADPATADTPAVSAAPEPAPADPAIPIDTPAPDPGPVACGLEIWRKGMPRLPHAKIAGPAPAQLPPEATPDLPAAEPSAAPVQTKKSIASQPMPPQIADAPAPTFAPVAWTPPPPQPAEVSTEPETVPDGAPAPVPAMPGTQPSSVARLSSASQPAAASAPAPDAQQPSLPNLSSDGTPSVPHPVAPQPQAAQPPSLPNSFTLPPDVAREIAQLVKAAVGERDGHDSSDSTAPLPAAAPPLPQAVSSQPAPLHPSFAAAHRPVIDTGRAEWMQAMIDRIAEMPQSEGGNRDAQIRLVPDALGPVDVKIEQRQDRLHVTLHAETPQARLLLSDAAPKLHELAEARGIRFAQTGFGGADPQDRRHAPDQQPATPSRPRPAASGAAEPDSHSDGDLIA
jgi:hypothetical protein